MRFLKKFVSVLTLAVPMLCDAAVPEFMVIRQHPMDKVEFSVAEQGVTNGSVYTVTLANRDSYPRDVKLYVRSDKRMIGKSSVAYVDNAVNLRIGKPGKVLAEDEYRASCHTGWIGMIDGNMLDAWLPRAGCDVAFDEVIERDSEHFRIGMRSDWVKLSPGESKSLTWQHYNGPLSYVAMRQFDTRLVDVYDAPPSMRVLEHWYRWVMDLGKEIDSYALGVILLAMIMRLLLSPIQLRGKLFAERSARMADEIEALRAHFGEDTKGMRVAMRGLYKQHNLNPVSGFLCTLLPMPIMIALMVVVTLSLQLHGERFFWVEDLAGIDRTYMMPMLVLVVGLIPVAKKWLRAQGAFEAGKLLIAPMFGAFIFSMLPASVSLFFIASAPIGWIVDFWVARRIAKEVPAAPSESDAVVLIVP